MARYKERSQDNILVPINFSQQLLPGTFEFTMNEIVDHQIDLSVFDQFYDNDEAGPPKRANTSKISSCRSSPSAHSLTSSVPSCSLWTAANCLPTNQR